MITRFAKKKDASTLARIHLISSRNQPDGFMHKMGLTFLKKYYKIIIEDRSSVILCAVGSQEEIIGFVSGTIDNAIRLDTLNKNRISILISFVPALLKSPSLFKEVYSRYASISSKKKYTEYIVLNGAREDYWGWKESENRINSSELHLKWLNIMRILGVEKIKGEVDKANNFILKIHQIFGAKIIQEFTTPDHRKRCIIEYDLTKSKEKQK